MWRINLRILVLTLVVLGFYTGIAQVIPQLQSEVPEQLDLGADVTPEALVAAGARVYQGAGGCTACHGVGTRAPNLLTDHAGEGLIGVRCLTRRPGMGCKAYLYESLTDPGSHVVPGFQNIMPDARRQIPEDQIWAVVAYLESQGGEVTVNADDLPRETAGAPVPAAGAATSAPAFAATLDPVELLRANGCLACHPFNGAGAEIGPPFDGMGRRVNADRIRRKILNPRADTTPGYERFAGTMPAGFGRTLSAEQLEAVVRFLAERR